MAKFYSELTESLQNFIKEQHIFFTATAPTQGRINLSPKAMDTFRCLAPTTVAYLDLTGSGNETAAHLHNDGRLTIMFCSFTNQPLILRLYGQGRVIRTIHPEWESLYPYFPSLPGTRQIVVLEIESIQTSCGYGVPLYEFQCERKTLIEWAEKKGEQGLYEYWQSKNLKSIDGLTTDFLSSCSKREE